MEYGRLTSRILGLPMCSCHNRSVRGPRHRSQRSTAFSESTMRCRPPIGRSRKLRRPPSRRANPNIGESRLTVRTASDCKACPVRRQDPKPLLKRRSPEFDECLRLVSGKWCQQSFMASIAGDPSVMKSGARSSKGEQARMALTEGRKPRDFEGGPNGTGADTD
jgi:hypothetical protein